MLQADRDRYNRILRALFQLAPTLGGECYAVVGSRCMTTLSRFNGHPPLGVNATISSIGVGALERNRFNGHPPLGVNATHGLFRDLRPKRRLSFNGHPPLGVNATLAKQFQQRYRNFG